MDQPSSQAVFLSYAREDTDAARRIADALRAFGIEVWFDQSELRGGDMWDQKIKKQIRECALFLPIVSANTQARREGYFRREWKLAVERTHDMAASRVFLVPVVIDDTAESRAEVPEEFMHAQWTRLQRGEPNPHFIDHVKRLFEPQVSMMETGRSLGSAALAKEARPVEGGGGAASPVQVGRALRPRPAWIVGIAVAVIVFGVFAWNRLPRNSGAVPLRESAPQVSALPTSDPSAVALAKADKSIAVLPFANMSDDKDASAFFADGIHEDILTNLAHIRELRVISRTSVMEYRGKTDNIRQIAQKLGVTYVLEGSVRRAGNRVRVTGQLIRATSDEHVWAQSYDRDLSDIFAIQAELAHAIAGELKAALSPQEKTLLEHRPTANIAAYDLYLKARELLHRDERSSQNQESLLQAAVTLDPQFAAAWAALGRAHAHLYFTNRDRSQARLDKARIAVDTAVRLAPDLPEVIYATGNYYYYGFSDFARAEQYFLRVARMQPNDSEVISMLGALYRRTGRWAEAVASLRKSGELDPGNSPAIRRFADLLSAGRRYDEAIVQRRRLAAQLPENLNRAYLVALESFQANGSRKEVETFFAGLTGPQAATAVALTLKRSWAVTSGNLEEYLRLEGPDSRGTIAAVVRATQGDLAGGRAKLDDLAEIRKRLEADPSNATLWSRLSQIEALLDHKAEAVRCARKAAELVAESTDARSGPAFGVNLAFVHAWTGDKDAAIDKYARLLRVPYSGLNVHEMRRDPHFFPLRGDPRFEALLNDPKNNQPLF